METLIWVCTVCLCTTKTLGLYGLIQIITVEIQLQKIDITLIPRAFTERIAWDTTFCCEVCKWCRTRIDTASYLLFPSSFIINEYMIKMVNLFVGFTNFFHSLIYVNHYERGQPICGRNGLFIGRRLVILKIYMRMYFIYFLRIL